MTISSFASDPAFMLSLHFSSPQLRTEVQKWRLLTDCSIPIWATTASQHRARSPAVASYRAERCYQRNRIPPGDSIQIGRAHV